MSLRDEWLDDPEPLPYVEWLRRRTVPAGLLVLQTPEENQREVEKAERKPSAYKRKSRANPNGRQLVHGTTQGRRRHIERGEEVCAECQAGFEADKVRRAAAKREARARKRREPPKCGTPQKARKHRRDGEPVCEPCKQSERDEWHNRQKEKAA